MKYSGTSSGRSLSEWIMLNGVFSTTFISSSRSTPRAASAGLSPLPMTLRRPRMHTTTTAATAINTPPRINPVRILVRAFGSPAGRTLRYNHIINRTMAVAMANAHQYSTEYDRNIPPRFESVKKLFIAAKRIRDP